MTEIGALGAMGELHAADLQVSAFSIVMLLRSCLLCQKAAIMKDRRDTLANLNLHNSLHKLSRATYLPSPSAKAGSALALMSFLAASRSPMIAAICRAVDPSSLLASAPEAHDESLLGGLDGPQRPFFASGINNHQTS